MIDAAVIAPQLPRQLGVTEAARRAPRHRRPAGRTTTAPRPATETHRDDVVTESRLGDPGAREERAAVEFGEYVRNRRTALLRVARQITGDRSDPEDLLQEGLLRTFAAYRRIEDSRALGAYLRRTMTNQQISQWRRARLAEYPCESVPDSPVSNEALQRVELRAVLTRAMSRLSARERTIIGMRYYQSYTDSEIAEALGLSLGTVKSSLWRALRKLRDDESLHSVHADMAA